MNAGADLRALFEAGEVLFREGEAGDDAYIVEKGEIEISIDLPTGKKAIAELCKGEIIGEMSLIADAPRSATAIASVESELLVLKRDRLLKTDRSSRPDYTVDDPNDCRSAARCAALDARR